MSNIKRVLAVTNNFPTPRFPETGVFVLNILKEMYRQGLHVDVIAPISIGTELKRIGLKRQKVDFGGLHVRQPYYFNIPQRFRLLRRPITLFNDFLFGLALKWSYRRVQYDLIYCHFLQSAIPVLNGLPTEEAPILLNMGESDPWDYDLYYGTGKWLKYLHRIDAIVTVSKANLDYILTLDSKLSKKSRYIPNGVNTQFFRAHDRLEARKKLGLELETKYIVFCGHLDQRKGPLRVLEAIKNTDIKGIFLGSNGPDVPEGKEVAYVGPVENSLVPYYLSAADVFVLPSLSEGMSNAVLEAMSCCTPLVVSDKSFNTDFLTAEVAEFIDPSDSNEIRKGILRALDPDRNRQMKESLVTFREQFSIQTRIKRITEFVGSLYD